MKSRDRCRKHYQGDRCKLAENHKGNHAAAFHIWGSGTGGRVFTFAETDVPRMLRRLAKSTR